MEPFAIEVKNDDACLKGMLHLPELLPNGTLPPLVVGSHGLEGSMESAKQQTLAKLLPKHGMAFFRFDHRGCGGSNGDFLTDTDISIRTSDFLSAVTQVLALGKTSRVLGIFGSSMGGATCISAWPFLETMNLDLRCGIFCAAPVQISPDYPLSVPVNENGKALPLEFFENHLIFNLQPNLEKLHHVLVFHGDADEVVPVSNAHRIMDAAKQPARLIIQANGDHQMSNPLDQQEFEREALAWFTRFLTQATP